MTTKLGIVVPCYNEESVLPETAVRLLGLLDRLRDKGLASTDSAVYFVDDGSRDRTWDIISTFAAQNPAIRGIKLSRNQGHQNALLAGLWVAEGDALVSIDADLQDDIDVIEEMLLRFRDGYDIVYGVRDCRDSDTVFKRSTAQAYYRLLAALGVDVVYNHADYRLMSRRTIECLREYSEVNLFLRGIVPLLGFRATTVRYARSQRFAGESKYPLRKMLALAADGITSFSIRPLRIIAGLGLCVCLLSGSMIAWILFGALVLNTTVPGWASSVIPIYFLGGIQLLSMGIIGEYVAKTYMETKRRPRFFIEQVVGQQYALWPSLGVSTQVEVGARR